MIDPVTTAYLAAGTVAGATLAPALLLMWLQRAIERYAQVRRDAEMVLEVLEHHSERHHLETMQPSIARTKAVLEELQGMGERA